MLLRPITNQVYMTSIKKIKKITKINRDKNYLVQFLWEEKYYFCGTPQVHDKCPTVHSAQKSYRKDAKDNSTYKDENLLKTLTVNCKNPVE